VINKICHIILFFVLFAASPFSSSATHLMGGNFSYEFLGKSGSMYKYRITIDMYRDCYNSTTPFDNSISVGIYYNNISRNYYNTEYINLTSETKIDPPSGGSTCSFKPNVCIRRGIYQQDIYLPATTTGFHFYHVRCCRNNLTNLAANMGQTYYGFIPPNSYEDNSPYFTDFPTPYICAKDTVSISYAAIDPDTGDSLVYSLAYPWAGGTDLDPIPILPSNLPLPIGTVNYAPNYNVNKPFGNAGFIGINSSNGLVTVYVPMPGLFAIAVDVSSYRNGVLLTTIRRDIELIVLNCPPNEVPRRIEPYVTSLMLEEGDTLKFDMLYNDKDTMYFSFEGDIFGQPSTFPKPWATLTSISGKKDSIRNAFYWKTSCSHGRSTPYFFTVRVKDTGCPYKTRTDIYQVYVDPFKGADSIAGPREICAFTEGVEYRALGAKTKSTKNWTVEGGTIVGRKDTTIVKVNWGVHGIGRLRYFETSEYGCGPEMKVVVITIHELPHVDAGNDMVICSRDTVMLGNATADTSLVYLWTPSANLLSKDSATAFFTDRNTTGNPKTFQYFLKATDSNSCSNTDTVMVTVNTEPDSFRISGNLTPCFQGIFSYTVPTNAGSKYYWKVEGGTQITGGNTSKIDIQWTDTFYGKVSVKEINVFGCQGDTQSLNVAIVRPDATVYGPGVVCPNTVNVQYWVKNRQGSLYEWHVYNGYRSDGNGKGPLITVNWPDSGLALITVIETTKEGCVSDTAHFPVIISYHLKTSPIEGDTFVCEYSVEPYEVMNVNGSNYNWWLSGGILSSGNGKAKIQTSWGMKGMGFLKVLETSYDSVNDKMCIGDTVFQSVVINPVPVTSPVSGPENVCEYDTSLYFVHGFADSYYDWNVSDSNARIINNGDDTIYVIWNKKGSFVLTATELSKDSCYGPPMTLNVDVHPLPLTSDIFGPSVLCYPNTDSISYFVNGYSNSTFNWSINGGDILGQNGVASIGINWFTPEFGEIHLLEVSEWGCKGPLKKLNVSVDSLFPVMEYVSTLYEDEEKIGVHWDLKNDAHFKKRVNLYKLNDNEVSWDLIDSFAYFVREFVDRSVKTQSQVYTYKISVKNLCGKMIESLPHNSVLLDGRKTSDFDLYLHWNQYKNWPQGVSDYNLYRSVDGDSKYRLVESLSDTLINFEAGLAGINQCYRIAAVRNDNHNILSWSNEKCFTFDPVIYVPNAFSPNGDGLNDTFNVLVSNVRTFSLQIFNRWGQQIYQTDNPLMGWDGKFNNTSCPIGAYVFIIKYQGNSILKSISGTVTLIR